MVWGLLVLGVIGVGVYLAARVNQRRKERGFREVVEQVEALRLSRNTPSPDLKYAARGFAAIAVMKANEVEVDLHQAEYRLAEQALQEGATKYQALSLRWGGVQAIHTEPELYSMAVEAAKDAGSDDAYHHGALAHLAMVIDQQPKEFSDFMAYLQRS